MAAKKKDPKKAESEEKELKKMNDMLAAEINVLK